MSNFEFLKHTKEYALFAPAALEAERVYSSSPAMCAVGCRKALELSVKWVYSADNSPGPIHLVQGYSYLCWINASTTAYIRSRSFLDSKANFSASRESLTR